MSTDTPEYPEVDRRTIWIAICQVHDCYHNCMKTLRESGLPDSAYGMYKEDSVDVDVRTNKRTSTFWQEVVSSYGGIFYLCHRHGGCGNWGADGIKLVEKIKREAQRITCQRPLSSRLR
jgi:hypothetical protein